MRYPSPLRYPGGKRALARYIKLVFAINDIQYGHYVEPYAGGASVGLSLLFDDYVAKIHLNDLNLQVYAFWYSVLNDTGRLCSLIMDTPVTVDKWFEQRETYNKCDQSDLTSLGFSFFFLNRTNRSGILNGGIIGGKDQTGNYKIDVRYNKDALVKRIERIARYKKRIHLYNLDAKILLENVVPELPDNTLLYLDPPYYKKGGRLYDNSYTHQDHEEIRNTIRDSVKKRWIVSYDNVSEIHDLYQDYKHEVYSLSYSSSSKYQGSEVMFYSESLILPDVPSPAYITPERFSQELAGKQLRLL